MAQLLVMYKTPQDTKVFDTHYQEVHVPLAKKLPGLRKFEVSYGPVLTPSGPSGVHLIATLHFDDVETIAKAFGSPEGQAAAADAQSMGAHDIFLFDNREV